MDRKNTLLLTVIAIATLLVAVVGATFAFFTAQNTGKGETEINVKTETTTSVVFDQSNNIDILANMNNFTQDKIQDQDINTTPSDNPKLNPHTMGTSNPSIKLTGSSTVEGKDKVCYTTTLRVYKNDFEYKPDEAGKVTPFNEKKAELLLVVKKQAQGQEAAKEYTATEIPDVDNVNKYVSSETLTGYYPKSQHFATTYAGIQGFDITTLGASATCIDENGGFKESSDLDSCTTVDFKIPVPSDDPGFGSDATKYIHVLEAGPNELVTDKWEISVYFLNHDEAQNYNSAGKRFAAKVVLETTPCPGAAIPGA